MVKNMKNSTKGIILFTIAVLILMGVFSLGYYANSRSLRSSLLECSAEQIEKGYMWTIESNGTSLSVYDDGRVEYGNYDEDSNKWSYGGLPPDAEFAERFKKIVRDYFDKN